MKPNPNKENGIDEQKNKCVYWWRSNFSATIWLGYNTPAQFV
jgi:hypothetical protein